MEVLITAADLKVFRPILLRAACGCAGATRGMFVTEVVL